MKFPVFKDFFFFKKIFFKHRIRISVLCKIYLVSDLVSKLIFQELYIFVTLGTKNYRKMLRFFFFSFLSSILKHQIVAIFQVQSCGYPFQGQSRGLATTFTYVMNHEHHFNLTQPQCSNPDCVSEKKIRAQENSGCRTKQISKRKYSKKR